MNYAFQEILDIGLEIEFSNIKRDTGIFMDTLYKKIGNFKSVHDASAESPEITLGNIPIQFDVNGNHNKFLSILKFKGLETIGGELNSPILSSKSFKEDIYRLTDFLLEMGESVSTTEQDNRGSIHVHINVSKDIRHKHIIRLLEVGLATEALFYKLAGMGRINRGIKNNFAYQRPITMPPCIYMNSKFYPIFDYKDLLKTTGKIDFYNKYGDTAYQIENGNHYVTQRYTGLNFYSIPFRGSIEFRYCNKTLIPEWICAWIILCQSFVNYALTKEKDETFENTYRKLEDNKEMSDEEVMFIFDKFGISEDDIITLMDIWHQSTIPYFNGQHILSHLENPTFFHRELKYYPSPVTEAFNVDVVNVRKLNNEKSSIISRIRNDYPETVLDYVMEEGKYPHKAKKNELLEDLFKFQPIEELDNGNQELIPDTIEFYNKMGFNIEDFNNNDANKFASHRIQEGKFLPFRILRRDWWYEFDTIYDDLSLKIRTNNIGKQFDIIFVDTANDINSEQLNFNSMYKVAYRSFGFDFSDIIAGCHYTPEKYFPNEEEEVVFEEEEDSENAIEVNDEQLLKKRLEQIKVMQGRR